MEKLYLKTSIKCGGCVQTVTPFLNDIEAIANWQVDLENPDRILEIEGSQLNQDKIIETLKLAGYTAEIVNK